MATAAFSITTFSNPLTQVLEVARNKGLVCTETRDARQLDVVGRDLDDATVITLTCTSVEEGMKGDADRLDAAFASSLATSSYQTVSRSLFEKGQKSHYLGGYCKGLPVYEIITPIRKRLQEAEIQTSFGPKYLMEEPVSFIIWLKGQHKASKTKSEQVLSVSTTSYLSGASGEDEDESWDGNEDATSDFSAATTNETSTPLTPFFDQPTLAANKPSAGPNRTLEQPTQPFDHLSVPITPPEHSAPDPNYSSVLRHRILKQLPPTPDQHSPPLKNFFNEYFEVKESPIAGLGAFAVKDIARGEHILFETPLIVTSAAELLRDVSGLCETGKRIFYSLHGHSKKENAVTEEKIATANGFRAQEFNTFQICPIAARFNHACQISGKVNVKYLFDESRNCISLSAAQDVPRGAELLICYTPVANQLEQQYGFQCGCLTHGKPRDEVDVDWDRFWEE